MPKKTPRRIIDTRRNSGATILSGITVNGTSGGALSSAAAGAGLTYDGAALNVGAGNGITVNADDVALASSSAGAGLTYSSGVLAVGAGTLVTVGADSVGITDGSNYQFIGTGAGTSAAWQNLSGLAGDGLTHTAGVLAVGVANTGGTGLTVEADAVRLTSYSDRTGSTSGVLYAASGNLKLTTQNISSTVGYTSFTSGFAGSGWRIDYGSTEASKSSAEFDNLTIRGRMRVYELLIQQIRATNGSVFVSSSSKVYTVTNTTNPLWTVNGSQLTFNGANATLTFTWCQITTSDSDEETADRTHYHGFLYGDIIRAQQVEWDGADFGGIMQSNLEVTSVTDLYTYGAALVSGDAPAVGYDYVRLGNISDTTRQGTVYLTSDDSNAPFIDIVDGVTKHADWNTAGKIKARLGKLSGITDAQWGALSGYGLWSDNVYLTGNIYATDGIFNGTVTASSGAIGGWTIGSTSLTSGSGANTVGLDTGGTNPAIYAGSATPGSAPFRVTQAGAVTASNISLTGGGIDGVLSIGASGEIRQGSGTLGSNFTGLRMWYDSGIGRIGGYNSDTLQWYAGTDGYLYGGDGTNSRFRLGNESFRSVINTGSYKYGYVFIDDITSSSWTTENLYGTLYSWKVTTGGSEDFRLLLYSRVNSSLYTTYDSRIDIGAQSSDGYTVRTSNLVLAALKNGGARRMTYSGDYAQFSSYVILLPVTAPGAPSSGVSIYCDTSTGYLMAHPAGGSAKQLAP